jgi:hypothetical protein
MEPTYTITNHVYHKKIRYSKTELPVVDTWMNGESDCASSNTDKRSCSMHWIGEIRKQNKIHEK